MTTAITTAGIENLVKDADALLAAAKTMPERTRALALQTCATKALQLAQRRDRSPSDSTAKKLGEAIDRYLRAEAQPLSYWAQNAPTF